MKPQTTNRMVAGASRVWNWLRANTDLVMLAAMAVIVVTGWLAIELADEVLEGTTQRYDEWVLRLLRTPGDMTDPIGPAWFEDMWRDVTALGSATVLTLATLACAGYLLMRKQYGMLVLLAVTTVGGQLVSLLLKDLIDRPRPAFDSGAGYIATSSFPSGHSMLSAVVYLTMGTLLARASSRYHVKIYFLTMAMLVTLLVGISRVYLGVHYPTDVLAGWSIGVIWALLCWLVAQYLQKRGTIEPPKEMD
ncbi:MAG: phosphatase PAP2 family protein [Phycisphaerales bacterium]